MESTLSQTGTKRKRGIADGYKKFAWFRSGEVISLYPLLPNKMSMERDSNGCCIMCILVIAIISKRIWECVQLEIKRRKKSESYLRRRHCRG